MAPKNKQLTHCASNALPNNACAINKSKHLNADN